MTKAKLFWLLATVLLITVSQAQAQQARKLPVIGYLSNTGREAANAEAFRKSLTDLGYVDGKTIAIEHRSSDGNTDRLPGLAAELVRLRVDVIVAAGGAPGGAAKNATVAIPIIFVGSTDPVAAGLVASLARPGGNITGFTVGAQGLYGKRLELLHEVVPRLSRVGLLLNPTNPSAEVAFKEVRGAGQELNVKVQSLEVRRHDDIDRVFEATTKTQIEALVVAQHPPINTYSNRVIELAVKRRLPAIYQDKVWPDTGGFMSYGPSISDLYRRAAIYVDKILRGAKPADLPVEQPTKFEFVVNLKTAKQIGLTIPPNVLVRADRVIR